MSRVMRSAVAVDYPYSDGRPMAESYAQLRTMLYVLAELMTRFKNRSDVFVGGDMFVYYEEGNPAAVVAPDVFVVMGAPKREKDPRLSYKLWEEPKGPDFVLEVASRSTWAVDRDEKPEVYARLGVEEYWLYDPTGEHLASRIRGMRLSGGRYRDLPPVASRLGVRKLRSAVLGLDVGVDRDGAARLYDPETGKALLGHAEERAAREAAEKRVEREAAARQAESAAREAAEARARREAAAREAAEARARQETAVREAAEARARQETAVRETAEARARQETAARETAEARARQETAAREAAEARISELQALLRKSGDES